MDKFVAKYKKELEKNPNIVNHLNNTNSTKRKKNKISNYFKVEIKNKNVNQDDDDIEILQDIEEKKDDNINRSQPKKNVKFKQLKIRNNIDIDTKNEIKLKNEYLFVSPLMNQRYLFEMMELSGIRNNGSKKRLSQLYSRNITNINSDSLYRINLHSIINNQHLHRLPIGHSFNKFNEFNYISSIKFDKIGSLFCNGSTNGEIGIFDFDKCLLKWNKTVRNKYNDTIINLKKQNIDIKQGCDYSKITMDNIILTKINTGFKIENIEWSQNMNDIAVCGHGGGLLNIYDLRRLNNKPKYKLITPSSSYHPLLINKYYNNSSMMIAGDRMGSLFCWDLKINNPCFIFNKYINNHFAIKQIYISNDGILLYIIRENGFIQIMDIRKTGHIYKSIDIYSNTSTSNRAKIDDGIILESMNCALLKLQNNSLVNVHFESGKIRKTYSFQQEQNDDNSSMINVEFLSKVMQRRMCSFEQYGMPEMLITGTFKSEMNVIDMSTELDAYFFEKEYKENNKIKLDSIDSYSFGLMGKTELSSIMTSCSLHPKLLYIVCGTLNNCLEIVSCASNPF